jgi:[ribosomal protein S18]-alanine N-acetyltransferase
MITSQISVSPYARRYRGDLLRFLQHEDRLHIHLDWHTVDEWIASPDAVMFVAAHDRKLIGVIGASAALNESSWLRLLALSEEFDTDSLMDSLWQALEAHLMETGVTEIAALILYPWLLPHLRRLGFDYREEIVTLRREGTAVPRPLRSDITVRRADWRESGLVEGIDHAAFEPIWQLDEDTLRQAARMAYSFTIADLDGKNVGYQISTMYNDGVHLARLATLPEVQGAGIGGVLLGDMIERFVRRGLKVATVNTQRSNKQSQRLYQRYGFDFTGLDMSVWSLRLQPAS